jgi:hypothetical protein
METAKGSNYWTDGAATRKLAEIVPLENIKICLYIYKKMSETDIPDNKMFSPLKEILSIRKKLEKLNKDRWIESGAINPIMENIWKTLSVNKDQIIKWMAAVGQSKAIMGPSHDKAFDFLIYALIFDAKNYLAATKQNMPLIRLYDIVCDFLQEQDILPVDGKRARLKVYDRSTLATRYGRIKENHIRRTYLIYLAYSPDICSLPSDIAGIYEGYVTSLIGYTRQSK